MEKNRSEAILLDDTSLNRIEASLISRAGRGDAAREAKLAHHLIEINKERLADFEITADVDFDGQQVYLVLQSGSKIGAFPLLSPLSGKPEISLIVRPRFGWPGVGRSLGASGFKVIPQILNLPLLPKTEREIPDWILSATILARLKTMLAHLSRRFEITEDVRRAPRGRVEWGRYVTEKLPVMKFLDVPCSYPDLRPNQELFSAIHFVLRKQLASLETQRHSGMVVIALMQICLNLLRLVDQFSPISPTRKKLDGWFRTPLAPKSFFDGLHAITWSTEETGLGGMTDWRGLPWVMSMEEFYEAWVETFFQEFTRRYGGILRVGRRRETITPIAWEHPALGSQKYLLPDLVIHQEGRTIFIDAKYKDHLEALQNTSWSKLEGELRERHRADLLQVLAYSTLSETGAITACLTYPCTLETWQSLMDRDMLIHRASIYAGSRKIDLVMAALPIGQNINELMPPIASALEATNSSRVSA